MTPFTFSPQLNQEYLHAMYENDLDYAGEVFSIFINETGNDYQALKTLYADNDVLGFRQKLHKMKPAFSFVGLTSLTDECEELIILCDKTSDLKTVKFFWHELSGKIEQGFDLTAKELNRMKTFTV